MGSMESKLRDPLAESHYKAIRKQRHISRSARIILGLLNLGCTDVAFMSRAIGGLRDCPISLARASEIRQAILDSGNPIIRDALLRGLRRTDSAHFKGNVSFRCICGALLCWVPCMKCCCREGWDFDPDEDREMPVPAKPTEALPGTREKIKVMRQRVARGESPFHPLDQRR